MHWYEESSVLLLRVIVGFVFLYWNCRAILGFARRLRIKMNWLDMWGYVQAGVFLPFTAFNLIATIAIAYKASGIGALIR